MCHDVPPPLRRAARAVGQGVSIGSGAIDGAGEGTPAAAAAAVGGRAPMRVRVSGLGSGRGQRKQRKPPVLPPSVRTEGQRLVARYCAQENGKESSEGRGRAG